MATFHIIPDSIPLDPTLTFYLLGGRRGRVWDTDEKPAPLRSIRANPWAIIGPG